MKSIASIGALLLCPWCSAIAQEPAPPAQQTPAPQTPTAKPQVGQSTYEDIESVFSLSVFYWKPTDGDARLAGGKLSPDPTVQTIDFAGKPKAAPGVILTFPTGRSNRLELSVWEAKSSGSLTATQDYFFFSEAFEKGDFLVTENRIRSAKLSWNYLSYPYPPLDSKFRIKTLWEVQYVQARPVITAPFTAIPEAGGNPAIPAIRSTGTRKVILPTLGLGIELIPSAKHFRLEARGSGMAFPGKSQIWDAEGSAVVRMGNLEIFAGGKYFHFRTTPNEDQYMQGNLWGPFGGVRWVFR